MKSKLDEPAHGPAMTLPEALRCPMTKLPLELEPNGDWVRVIGQPIRYPVRDGVPILVAGAAERLDEST